jgi:amino acid transporter
VSNLKRHFGQKAAFVSAIVCVVLAFPMFGIFIWLLNERGMNDTWTPSALTTGFFFLFCAVVLYVLSRPQPPLPVENVTVDS